MVRNSTILVQMAFPKNVNLNEIKFKLIISRTKSISKVECLASCEVFYIKITEKNNFSLAPGRSL